MGVRDLKFWTKEANRRQLIRQKEAAEAALLPVRKDADIKAHLDRIRWAMYELDYADDIAKSEQDYAERVRKGLHRPHGKSKKRKAKEKKK